MALKLQHIFVKWRSKCRRNVNPWIIGVFLITLLVSLPLLFIAPEMLTKGSEVWRHMLHNLVPVYVKNTTLLMTGVAVITFIIGVGSAWLVSMYQFPGRRVFSWALILPLSIPAYISGFAWAGFLDYTSPLYSFFRHHFQTDTGAYLFFNILSMPGAIAVLSFALYPYVYLITKAYFARQSTMLFEVSASLGRGPWGTFFRAALPLARPAIMAGISLALMEVLNDYGLVRYFGIDTFTTGIFSAWFSFADTSAALKLSGYLMMFVLFLLVAERLQRGKLRYADTSGKYIGEQPRQLKGVWRFLVIIFLMLPLLAGFLIPFGMLLYWSIQTMGLFMEAHFWHLIKNSLVLSSLAAALVMVTALLVAFTVRTFPNWYIRLSAKISTLGYAIPGAVVAVGIMIPLIWIDHRLVSLNLTSKYIITGTWIALLYAYLVRFMAVGYNSIESGMQKISISMDEASRSLGLSVWDTMRKVNIPLLRSSMITAFLLVFIDVLKELPLTLILRPFNFDTLAIRAFEYASDERVAEAGPAAMIIVLTGFIPVVFLYKLMDKKAYDRT